jgi:hypothetical protein
LCTLRRTGKDADMELAVLKPISIATVSEGASLPTPNHQAIGGLSFRPRRSFPIMMRGGIAC